MSQGVVVQDGDMVGIDAPGLGWLGKPGGNAIFEALILSTGAPKGRHGDRWIPVRETGDRYSGEIAGKSP